MISKNKTEVNEFSQDLWNKIYSQIEKALSLGLPKIAAFDADGTLWDNDAGETFFEWQIQNSNLKDLPENPWNYYHELKSRDPVKGYLWLAQINAGLGIKTVQSWADQCLAEQKNWPFFKSQKALIDYLFKNGFEVFVVTASIKWSVEPFARALGIDSDHVLGVMTEIENGVVGTKGILPITWRDGKAHNLLSKTKGQKPILASGNTLGDISLLETASHVQLAISSQPADATQSEKPGLWAEEDRLRKTAQERGWLQHHFR